MLRMSCSLRVFARRGAPVVAMTATATAKEIQRVTEMLGLQSSRPVVISSCPVQRYHKFSVLRRPSNCHGLMGTVDQKGVRRPGLYQLLKRLYLGHFLRDIKAGRKPKRCIIFFRSNKLLGAVYNLLQKLTGQYNPSTADFVMNHSSLLPPDDRMLQLRREEISNYLASNKMLMGTDLPNLDVAIFCQPFDSPAALLQGGGRLSRRTTLGYRTAGQVYQLFNGSDLTVANKQMKDSMRMLCRESEFTCTKQLLREIFAVDQLSGNRSSLAVTNNSLPEELRVEQLEAQQQKKSFMALKKKISSCIDPAELVRLLRSDAEVTSMLLRDGEEGDHVETAGDPAEQPETADSQEDEENYCCHYHDVLKFVY